MTKKNSSTSSFASQKTLFFLHFPFFPLFLLIILFFLSNPKVIMKASEEEEKNQEETPSSSTQTEEKVSHPSENALLSENQLTHLDEPTQSLYLAIQNLDPEKVSTAIQNGANINAETADGKTALFWILEKAKNNYQNIYDPRVPNAQVVIRIIKILREAGVTYLDESSHVLSPNPLFWAAQNYPKNPKVIKELLKIDKIKEALLSVEFLGQRALDALAANLGSTKIAKQVLKIIKPYSIDTNITTTSEEYKPTFWQFAIRLNRNLDVIKIFTEARLDRSSLTQAKEFEILLDALTNAQLYNSAQVLEYLIKEFKLNIYVTDHEGNQFAHRALSFGPLNVIQFLIEKLNINPNITDQYKNTVLHSWAMKNPDYNKELSEIVIPMLLKAGFDPLALDQNQLTPKDTAKQFNNKTMIEILEQWQAKQPCKSIL